MITKNEIKPYLESLARQYPKTVMSQLNKGDLVEKSMGLTYEIDDINLYKKLGDFPKGKIPYGSIYRALRNSKGEILKLFNNSKKIPFSKAYEAGLGECLEKAILTQLCMQREGDCFLINGSLEIEGVDFAEFHAYNIVFRNGEAFLVDVENPLAKDKNNKITYPYLAPILGIDGDYSDIVVPEKWIQGRRYSIT